MRAVVTADGKVRHKWRLAGDRVWIQYFNLVGKGLRESKKTKEQRADEDVDTICALCRS